VLNIGALALVRAAVLCCAVLLCVVYARMRVICLFYLNTHTAHSHIHTQQTPAAFSPLTAALYLPAPLISLAAAARALLLSPPAPTADANSSGSTNGFSALTAAAFARPTTAAGWGYLVAGLLYVFTLAACYAPEEALFTGGDASTPLALLLKRTWAPGFWMAGAACAVLRDAADRGRLGASTFRRLNWASRRWKPAMLQRMPRPLRRDWRLAAVRRRPTSADRWRSRRLRRGRRPNSGTSKRVLFLLFLCPRATVTRAAHPRRDHTNQNQSIRASHMNVNTPFRSYFLLYIPTFREHERKAPRPGIHPLMLKKLVGNPF
jgi:hypothetical protein